MACYMVQLEGQNFLLDVEGKVDRYGFVTFRAVDSDDPSQAELAAAELVRQDESLRARVRNGPDDRPTMHAIEMWEIESIEETRKQLPEGFIFYLMNPPKWWQFWKRWPVLLSKRGETISPIS